MPAPLDTSRKPKATKADKELLFKGVTLALIGLVILLAPYVLYLGMNLLAGLMALWCRALPFPVASTVFVWLFIVPIADIANTAVPYALWNTFNDFHRAFGPSSPVVSAALLGSGLLASWYGYWLNRQLYGPQTLGVPSYCALAAAGMGVVLAINSIWLV